MSTKSQIMYCSSSATGGVTTGIHTRVNGIPKYHFDPSEHPSFSSLIVSLFLSSYIQLTHILIYTFSTILLLWAWVNINSPLLVTAGNTKSL